MATTNLPPPKPTSGQHGEELSAKIASDVIEITMTGGTVIRIPAERGESKPYDLLLAALKECSHWDAQKQAWQDGDPFTLLRVVRCQNPNHPLQNSNKPGNHV